MFPIDFFWRAAQRWPDRIAIDAPEGAIRYDALAARVAALAAGFIVIDPTPQSRVGICAGNSADHIAALLAVLACGKVWVPLNPKSTRPEIRRIIDATEPTLLVLDAACADLPCLPARRPMRSAAGRGARAISHQGGKEHPANSPGQRLLAGA